ncbi:general substrate transporter [Trichoderma sp. SZMC 28011]
MFGDLSIKVKGADCGVDAILLAIITSIGGFLFGYDIGQISGTIVFDDFVNRFLSNGSPTIKSLLVSFFSIGCLFGALAGAYTSDWFGRRKSIALGVFIFILGDAMQVTATHSWIHLTMGRFVAGLGIGNLSVGVPMFQSECAPREIRGAVVASYQLLITIGILFGNVVCYFMRRHQENSETWRLVIGIGALYSIPLGEKARQSLSRLRGKSKDPSNVLVENDMHEMREVLALERQTGTASWIECFSLKSRVPKTRYRTFLGMGIHFLQQWTGINYFFYYGTTIFSTAHLKDPFLVQLILGAVNVATTFLAVYLVDKFGRRWPLILGALWQAVWLMIFASIGTATNHLKSVPSSYGVVMVLSSCMFIASFAATWGPIPWIVMGETFTLRTRAKQASLATAANWLGNFLIGFLTPHADRGLSYAFGYILASANLAAAAVVWMYLYESSLLSLESVDIMYSMHDIVPWESARWVPPGYVTRRVRDEQRFRRLSIQEMVEMANKDASVKSDENAGQSSQV